MKILAVDPGNIETAYVLMDGYRPIEFGKIPNDDALTVVSMAGLHERAEAVVIEMIASYGMPVGREVFDTCIWIGRYTQTAMLYKLPVFYVLRAEVKLNLCKDSKAKDSNISHALIDRFSQYGGSGKGTKKKPDWFYGFAKDIWAAYAVGVTWMDGQKQPLPFAEEA